MVGGAVVAGGAVVGGAVVAGGAVVGGAVVGGGAVVAGGGVVAGAAVVVVALGAEEVVVLVAVEEKLEVVVTAGTTRREKIEAGDLLRGVGIPTPRLASRAKTRLVGRGRGWAAELSVRSDWVRSTSRGGSMAPLMNCRATTQRTVAVPKKIARLNLAPRSAQPALGHPITKQQISATDLRCFRVFRPRRAAYQPASCSRFSQAGQIERKEHQLQSGPVRGGKWFRSIARLMASHRAASCFSMASS